MPTRQDGFENRDKVYFIPTVATALERAFIARVAGDAREKKQAAVGRRARETREGEGGLA